MGRKNSTNWAAGNPVLATRLQHFNQDLDDLYALGSDRLRIYRLATDPALQVTIGAGAWRVGDSEGLYNGGTLTVVNSATTLVMIDAGGAIQTSTSAWNSNYAKLGMVTAAGGVITAIVLTKNDAVGGLLAGKGIADMRASAIGTPASYAKQTVYGPEFRPQAGSDAGRLEVPGMTGIVSWWTMITYGNWTGATSGQYSTQVAYSNNSTDGQVYIFMRRGLDDTTWGGWRRITNDSFFGTGADGDVTVSTSITLTRDMHYNSLNVASGGNIRTDGYRIFVRGKLTVTGTIHDNGVNGTDVTTRARKGGGLGGPISGQTPSRAGYAGTGDTESIYYHTSGGGTGGQGGAETTNGKPGGTTLAGAVPQLVGMPSDPLNIKLVSHGRGGGGGGGGMNSNPGAQGGPGFGGIGGQSGGLVFILAKEITGAGSITATGGNGGNGVGASYGGGGGGGGGTGGTVVVAAAIDTFTGSKTAAGGAGGALGVGTSVNGTAGTAGGAGIVYTLTL